MAQDRGVGKIGLVTMLKRRAWAWVPAVLALLAFARALPGDFLIIDDDWLVSENPIVLHPSAANLRLILDPFIPREALGHEYLPLRDLSYTLDAVISRLGGWPLQAVCHADQILLYALCTLLLTLLVARLTGRRSWAFAAGALFALHPVHAEAVCWISSRKDLLGSAFALASALAWRRHREAAGIRQLLLYGGSWLGYLAAMLCKSPMSILPGLLLAMDLFFPPGGSRWTWRQGIRLLPFFAAFLPFKTLHVTHAMHGLITTGLPGIGRFETALTMLRVGMRYLGLLLMPLRGRASYQIAWSEGWGPAETACAAALGALAAAAAWLSWRAWRGTLGPRRAAFGLGLAWLGIALLPASNLLYRSLVLMADRYLFLPSAGACLAAAALLDFLASGPSRRLVLAGGLALGAAWLARDIHASANWLGTRPAAAVMIRESGGRHDFPHRMLGRDAALRGDLTEALRQYRKADLLIDVPHQNPQAPAESAADLGKVLADTGHAQDALALLDRALARFPNHVRLLGIRGQAWMKAGDMDKAGRDLEAQARIAPWLLDAWLHLGILHNNARRFAEAGEALSRALALAPGHAEALYYLGVVRQNTGDAEGAAQAFVRALKAQEGNFPAARNALANLHLDAARSWLEAPGRPAAGGAAEAKARVGRAVALTGPLADAEFLLGGIARKERDDAGAERHYREALRLKDDPRYRTALGEQLREKGIRAMVGRDPEAAYAAYREALSVLPQAMDTSGLRAHLALAAAGVLKRRFEAAAAAFERGDLEAARRGFLAALEVRPDFFEARFDLGLVLTRLKDRPGAAEAFRKACELRPEDFEAHLRLGDALAAASRADEARQAFEKARALAVTDVQREAVEGRLGKP